MPGNPFKKPFRGGKTKASPRSPQKGNPNKKFVPTPASPNGNVSRAVAPPRAPRVKVTTKARRGMSMPSVRQGAQSGTPGKTGSPPGGKPW